MRLMMMLLMTAALTAGCSKTCHVTDVSLGSTGVGVRLDCENRPEVAGCDGAFCAGLKKGDKVECTGFALDGSSPGGLTVTRPLR